MRIVSLLLAALAAAGTPPGTPYQVFRGDGTPARVEDIVAAASAASVTFLGETHDDPTAHTLELELLTRLHNAGPVVLSMEMFERDVQHVVDEYLDSLISEDHLTASGRAWSNYKSDYRPLVEFAKENRIAVVAANAPRRYVNRVSSLGQNSLEELGDKAKGTLPPLPYAQASDAYAKKFHAFLEKMRQEAAKSAKPGEPVRQLDPVRGLAAQSLWDASMAYSVAESLLRRPDARVLHVNGSFHSEERLGILDHLARYRPGTRSVVVTMVSHKSFPQWNAELANIGDFVIVTDPSLPRSIKNSAKK